MWVKIDSRHSKYFSNCHIKIHGTKVHDVNKVRDVTKHEILHEANPLTAVKNHR